MAERRILFLPGDGIGPEIMAQVRRLVDWYNARGYGFLVEEDLVGGAAIDAHGVPLHPDTLARAREVGTVMLGAVGGPKWDHLPFERKPERGLLALRKELGLFANLRPALVFDALVEASTLKTEVVRGLDLLILRELTGGVYFGEPRGIEELPDGERRAVDTQVYTTPEIRRIARVAFELARRRRNRVTSVEKANVMYTGVLWRQTVQEVHDREYPDVELRHMYADNCAMQLLRDPHQFDVIVTDNLFGDLLSDEAAMLTGSLGMLPSASLGERRPDGRRNALYEPVHGSAPDIAGRDLANPLACILSFAMLLRHSFDLGEEADRLEGAVARVLEAGYRTADIHTPGTTRVGTREMGGRVLEALEALSG